MPINQIIWRNWWFSDTKIQKKWKFTNNFIKKLNFKMSNHCCKIAKNHGTGYLYSKIVDFYVKILTKRHGKMFFRYSDMLKRHIGSITFIISALKLNFLVTYIVHPKRVTMTREIRQKVKQDYEFEICFSKKSVYSLMLLAFIFNIHDWPL